MLLAKKGPPHTNTNGHFSDPRMQRTSNAWTGLLNHKMLTHKRNAWHLATDARSKYEVSHMRSEPFPNRLAWLHFIKYFDYA